MPTDLDMRGQIRAARNAEKAQAEQAALTHLLAHRFVEASQCVIDYESKQVVQRGVGMDWKKVDPAGYAATLKAICGGRPKILARLSDVDIGVLAIGAAMMELWGTNRCDKWLPPNFKIDGQMDTNAAACMLVFFAQHRAAVESYKASGGVKYVEVSICEDSCEPCKEFSGKKYSLDNVPELPHPACTHSMGCRCIPLPIVSFESEKAS